ncbi:MAG: TRAP transporter fused permease subunit [Desulfarculus sp.]|nr:MAG: TRAP transporter fused permease subunit [Desulfarculus sp.]
MNASLPSHQGLARATAAVAVAMSLYHLLDCYVSLAGTIEHRMIHLLFALGLIFLSAAQERRRTWFWLLLLALALASVVYLRLNLERLLFDMGFPLPLDVVVGFIVLGVVFLACWQSFGVILPLMACLLLAYGFLGRYLGGPILSVQEIITTVDLTFGSYDLWGSILIISANVIFLFVLFGGLLAALGANDFFLELGKVVGRYSRSGPAMTAVISSCLMGMTTGQATPNIAVTGAFTIPLMKKVGYQPSVAASIEAAASGGAQIMPPIMGAGAFVMADLLGVSYAEIVTYAAIPALLYFASVALFVHLQAIKNGVQPRREPVDLAKLLSAAPLFMVPMAAILALLYLGYPAMLAAFWGVVSVLGLSLINPRTRPSWRRVLDGCVKGAVIGAKVAVACATLGPIIALVTKTGLGLTLGYSVELWAGGSLLLALLIAMGCVIVLGLEVPTVAAYLIAAMVAIPALVRLGLQPAQAHMFAFYFGAFSALTPPVGMAAIVASRIAGAPYVRTAWHSMAAAAAGFLVPFVFAYNGQLLLLPGAGSLTVAIAATLAGLAVFQVGFVGLAFTRMGLGERGLALAAGLGLLVFAGRGPLWTLPAALLLLTAALLWNLHRRRAGRPAAARPPEPPWLWERSS